jgi:hypothetical protein
MSPTPGTPPPANEPAPSAPAEPQQVAIWYFLAATFVFASPAWFGWDMPWWARVLLLVAGFGLIVVGAVQFAKEVEARRAAKAAATPASPPPPPTDTGTGTGTSTAEG